MKYEATRLSDMVLEVRCTYKAGEVFPFLLLSDLHYDHPYCNRDALHKVLDEAKERNALILMNGDVLCLMQAQTDKRGHKGALREEHKVPNYFDAVIADTAEKFSKWSDNILLLGDGNHETAVLKHKEVNPLDWLAHRLNADHNANVHRAGYHGFVRFRFEQKSGGGIRTFLLYHHHGKYGGVVTKGVLGVSRHGVSIPQPDCIWTGHTHDLWHVTHPQLMVNQTGNTYNRLVHHVKTGTWKDEFNKPGGFGVERIAAPKSQGGYWMEFSISGSEKDLKVTFTQAR